MKHKSVIIGLICLVIIAAGTGIYISIKDNHSVPMQTVSISADYPKYDSLVTLSDRADTVIKGKVVDYTYSELNVSQKIESDDEALNPGGEPDDSTIPYTIFTIEIEKTYKGSVSEGDTIQVKQLGGVFDNIEYVLEDGNSTDIEIEKKYVFFLETYSNSPASMVSPAQSSYEYDDNNNIVSNVKMNRGAENTNNEIVFTMEELESLFETGE